MSATALFAEIHFHFEVPSRARARRTSARSRRPRALPCRPPPCRAGACRAAPAHARLRKARYPAVTPPLPPARWLRLCGRLHAIRRAASRGGARRGASEGTTAVRARARQGGAWRGAQPSLRPARHSAGMPPRPCAAPRGLFAARGPGADPPLSGGREGVRGEGGGRPARRRARFRSGCSATRCLRPPAPRAPPRPVSTFPSRLTPAPNEHTAP